MLIIQHVVRLLIDVVLLHLFELIGVRCANEVALHVVDVAVRVHQVLLVLSLNLDPSHHYVVLDINALFLFLVSRTFLLIVAIWEETLVIRLVLLRLLMIGISVVVKYLLLLLVLILLLHLVSGRPSNNHAQVVFVVIALGLIILHLKQVIVLLL